MPKPCYDDRRYCILADHWEGCWKHGHEQPDKSKCPPTPQDVDAIWGKICDRFIAQGRRRDARRAIGASRGTDE